MRPRDIQAVLGLALLGAGVGFVYWPAALIIVGLFLLADSFLPAKKARRS